MMTSLRPPGPRAFLTVSTTLVLLPSLLFVSACELHCACVAGTILSQVDSLPQVPGFLRVAFSLQYLVLADVLCFDVVLRFLTSKYYVGLLVVLRCLWWPVALRAALVSCPSSCSS